MTTVELRCKNPKCQCTKRGKLLARIYNLPEKLKEKEIRIEVPCPKKKSRLVKLKL